MKHRTKFDRGETEQEDEERANWSTDLSHYCRPGKFWGSNACRAASKEGLGGAVAVGSGCDENICGSASGRAIISRRSQSFSARRRSFSCFSSLTWDSNSLADSSSAASRCFFLMRKRALAAVFLLRLSSSIARRFVSASASGLPVSTSLTRSASVDDDGRPR